MTPGTTYRGAVSGRRIKANDGEHVTYEIFDRFSQDVPLFGWCTLAEFLRWVEVGS